MHNLGENGEKMKEFDINIISNPMIFEQNRLSAHSDHIIYANEQERDSRKTSLRKCLNGTWKFAYAENNDGIIDGFEAMDFDSSGWADIKVPAHIQMEGYDRPHYANTVYPWEGTEWIVPGEIPTVFNPVASYITTFDLPEDWKDDKIIISFQGVESGFAIWINGEYVGYSENSFDPAEFDITPFVKSRDNKLAVRVWKWTASSWCEDQDFYRFSGIYRDVFIYPKKSIHVDDIKITTSLSEDYASGEVNIDMKCEGSGKAYITLYSPKTGVLYPDTADIKSRWPLYTEEIALKDGDNQISMATSDIKLWSDENPNLYVADIVIKDSSDKKIGMMTEFIGFRRFEITDGLMTINGQRVVFKGVNRHEFSAKSGRVASFDEVLLDVTTMKKHNINAIRTSHYPDCSHIYTDGVWDYGIYYLCDIFGLYIIAENNMETHGTMEAYGRGYVDESYLLPKDKPEWEPMLIDRIVSCYNRDKNHPAIVIWSMGNESYGGSVIAHMADKIRELDDTRVVHYEGIFNDRSYPDTSDIESQMYTKVEDIKVFLEEHPEKPFICCEYTHAMGNSCGGMHLYTELAYSHPRYQGGFIWDYIDQVIYKKDRYGHEFLAYGGDFGERPSDMEFSGNGIVYGNRMPSPKMQAVKYNYQNIKIDIAEDEITVINRNMFTCTDEFDCQVGLIADGKKILTETLETEVEPLCSVKYPWPKKIADKYAELKAEGKAELSVEVSFTLSQDCVWAGAGHELAFGQKIFKKEYNSQYVSEKPAVYVRGNNHVGIRGENFNIIFSRIAVGMVSYKYKGREMLLTTPRPNFWRAPTNNDDGYMMTSKMGQWKIASMYGNTRSKDRFEDAAPDVVVTDDTVILTYNIKLNTNPQGECKVKYEVFGDGTVEVSMHYDPVEGLSDMPEFGMLFKIEADYDNLEWYGLGPEETYVDRKAGAKIGVYKCKVTDSMAEYLVPQECGNRCGVRYARVTDSEGIGFEFEGDELSFSALPYTPHELENASHAYELPPVHNTIIRVAKQQMGVGGDDSWGAPVLPQYHIDVTKPVDFSFRFRAITRG